MNTIDEDVEDTSINPDLAEFERFPLENPLKIIYFKPSQWKTSSPKPYNLPSKF